MPVRSVLVAPVCPSSWMEMAGLVAEDWIGRTFTQYRAIIEEQTTQEISSYIITFLNELYRKILIIFL